MTISLSPVGVKPARAIGFAALAAVASALFAESSRAQRIMIPATCGDSRRASKTMGSLPRRLDCCRAKSEPKLFRYKAIASSSLPTWHMAAMVGSIMSGPMNSGNRSSISAYNFSTSSHCLAPAHAARTVR